MLIDGIDHKIIWTCHIYLILDNLMPPIYLGQYPDTPTYMDALSGRNIAHVRRTKGQQ